LGDSGIHGKAAKAAHGKTKRGTVGSTARAAAGAFVHGKPSPGRRASERRPERAPVKPVAPLKLGADGLMVMRPGWREAIERTVTSLHYDLVDVERAARGLLRVTIDRLPAHAYPVDSEFVLVEDCELVTRQLQYSLEVDGVDYARLEVSSPGLDRPLKREADYLRFEGQAVSITLKEPFEGRKVFKGVLARAEAPAGEIGAWTLTFTAGKAEQVLGFGLDEVREARLVPVLDFKGRRGAHANDVPAAGDATEAGDTPAEGAAGVNGG
jgi:ribosome maturation factor RimP